MHAPANVADSFQPSPPLPLLESLVTRITHSTSNGRGVVLLRNLTLISVRVAFCLLLAADLRAQVAAAATNGPPQPGILDSSKTASAPVDNPPSESKRLLGIVPNYRTSPPLHPYVPISPRDKFVIASEDAFDRGTFILAAVFAGEAQLTNANKAFGQGAAGYGRYLGTSYADYVIGDFMTEGIFPTLLHQDPRYFRKGSGSGWSRLGYAMGQIVFTHNDAGETAFNYSEILGNSAAVAISNAYYVNNRDASDAVVKLANQLGVDMASNILKEFWPEIQKKLSRKHRLRSGA